MSAIIVCIEQGGEKYDGHDYRYYTEFIVIIVLGLIKTRIPEKLEQFIGQNIGGWIEEICK